MSAREGGGAFPWAWLYYRALDCGMDAAAFWQASSRAIVTLYDCAKQARKPNGGSTGARAAPTKSAGEPKRLARLPR